MSAPETGAEELQLVMPEEANREPDDAGVLSAESLGGGLHLMVVNKNVQESVARAIHAFDPCASNAERGSFFGYARQIGPWVKSHLPNKNKQVQHLAQHVAAVQEECNNHGNYVVDFVQAVAEGTGKVQALGIEVNQLSQRGCQEIMRVESGAAWDPAVLKHQVESTRKRFDEVRAFVNGKAAQTREDLRAHRGKAIVTLMDEINGAGSHDLRADIVKSLAENASELQKHKQELNKQQVRVAFLEAEEQRHKLSLSQTEDSLAASCAEIKQAKHDVKACDLEEANSRKTARQHFEQQRAELMAKKEAGLKALQNDEQQSKLYQQSDTAVQEAANIATELNLANVQPDPPRHFILIIEKSYYMKGDKWDLLQTVVQTLANRRQELTLRAKDRASLVLYHKQSWIAVMDKTWSELLKSEDFCKKRMNLRWRTSQTKLSAALKTAKEVAEKVKPLQGLHFKTHLVLAAHDDLTDDDGPEAAQAAKELRETCARQGSVNGFVLLFGGDQLEMSLNDVIKNLNNGEDRFTDAEGESREFCSRADNEYDISEKFGLLTQCFNTDVLAAQVKFKYANEKQEKVAGLINRHGEQLMKRKKNLLNQIAEEEVSLQDAVGRQRESMASIWEARKRDLVEIQKGYQHNHDDLQILKAEQEASLQKLQEAKANASDSLESLNSIYEKVKANFTDDEYLKVAKEQLERAREEYSSMNPEHLVGVLSFAKEKLDDCQIIFDGILRSFDILCLPVENILNQLERSCEVDFTQYTAIRKIVECYRVGGLSKLDKTNFNAAANWQEIIRFHCTGAAQENVDLFTDAITINEVVAVCLLPVKEQAKAKKKLESKLRLTLQTALGRTMAGKAVIAQFETLTKKRKMLEERMDKLKDDIKDLSKEIAAMEAEAEESDAQASKRRRKESKLAAEEEKLSDAEQKCEASEEGLCIKQDEVEQLVETEYSQVLSMFEKVYDGVLNIFGQVMLTKGLDITSSTLRSLDTLFNTEIKQFCLESGKVSRAFLNSSSHSNTRSLALQYQATSSKMCLLDQFKHLAPEQSLQML